MERKGRNRKTERKIYEVDTGFREKNARRRIHGEEIKRGKLRERE